MWGTATAALHLDAEEGDVMVSYIARDAAKWLVASLVRAAAAAVLEAVGGAEADPESEEDSSEEEMEEA